MEQANLVLLLLSLSSLSHACLLCARLGKEVDG